MNSHLNEKAVRSSIYPGPHATQVATYLAQTREEV